MNVFYRVFTPPAACEPVKLNALPDCIFRSKELAFDYCIYIGESYGAEPLLDVFNVSNEDHSVNSSEMEQMWLVPFSTVNSLPVW